MYVATNGGTSGGFSSFVLHRVTPAGIVSTIGSYGGISHAEGPELEFGLDGRIYTADRVSGRIFAINPATGTLQLYNSGGPWGSLARYGLEFDSSGSLILMREAAPNRFYRVNPGFGGVYLGNHVMPSGFNHGDRFGIQPDGDYIIYPDNSPNAANNVVTEVITAGHVAGSTYGVRELTSTFNWELELNFVHSIGAIDPDTGDVYNSTMNQGYGSTRIAFTPGNVGPAATSSIFVDNIGNGVESPSSTSASRGLTDLDFGPRTDGLPGNSLFFLDDFTDRVYEVRELATWEFTVTVQNVAPSNLNAGSDATLLPPDAGQFSRTGITFTDPGTLDVHTVTVNYGDGSGDQTINLPLGSRSFDLAHTYTAEGAFTVSLRVDDDDVGSVNDSFEVTVILNDPPIANAGGPYVMDEGSALALDGSGSTDPDSSNPPDNNDDIVLYEWDLDYDGVTFDVDVSSPTPMTSGGLFADDVATRNIGLRVTDSHGETDVATTTLTVNNVDPVIQTVNAPVIDENGTATISGSFTDVGSLDTHLISTVCVSSEPTSVNEPLIVAVPFSSITGALTV